MTAQEVFRAYGRACLKSKEVIKRHPERREFLTREFVTAFINLEINNSVLDNLAGGERNEISPYLKFGSSLAFNMENQTSRNLSAPS